MTRILIVDDHPMFRKGLALSLGEAEDMAVCGEGANAADAVALYQELAPDLVLLDLSMPGGGHAALAEILSYDVQAKVAVLTASEDSDDVLRALRAGAAGYILKGVGGRTLLDAVRALAGGEGYVAPTLAARILSERSPGQYPAGPSPASPNRTVELLSLLTPKEMQVLRMVASGYSNKEVAHRTGTQEKTVKHHMTHILQKLNARNRTEAALLLRGAGGSQSL